MIILALDDSHSMRSMIQFTLESEGFEVDCFETAKQAIDALNEKNYSLILTDINMPEMDGYEFTKIVRSMEQYTFTPILCLTTEANQDKKLAGRDAGATGWIVKPFSPDKLVKTISVLLT